MFRAEALGGDKLSDADRMVIEELTELFHAEKSVSGCPEWISAGNRQATDLQCTSPLWTDGIVRLGLRMEAKLPQAQPPGRPRYGLTAMMFASVSGETLHLSRIEFDPISKVHVHRNIPNKVGAPPTIDGPHYHPFNENAALGRGALGLVSDLPIAFPCDETFTSFNDVLDVIRGRFAIPGLWLEEPPCSTLIV